ncbi:MAG: hypothetical protein FWG17_05015 [Desulfovibrionaceae bacterium]|nr:hypothetical protein [Desulfovibrionaceae bacterium]
MKRHILLALCLICALCLPLAAKAADDERQVVVTGVGMNEEDAKRQAYRNAVQSVVGAMVVAETLVENDALVRDKVLSHSDGYITKTEQVGQTVSLSGGLVEVTMKVTVKSQQLKDKLKAENISVIGMDGESLFTRAATQTEQTKDAAAIVAEALKNNLPASLISSAANIGQAEVKESGGTATVKVPISVSVNMDAYRKFTGDLKKTLTDLGYKGQTVSFGIAFGQYDFDEITVYDNAGWRNLNLWASPVCVIAICEMYSLESKQSRWTFFKVPKNVLEPFLPLHTYEPNYVEIKTDLYDGGQNLITSQNVRLTTNEKDGDNRYKTDIFSSKIWTGNDDGYGLAIISPVLRSKLYPNTNNLPIGNKGYAPGKLEATFVLDAEELKAAKSIQTSAQNVLAPAN